ncbi:MAG: ubiE6 [Bacteroidetes bacterium]|jgi:ubiquinone/menaquinone biosynthesis C-methylase UbiE|nr:ubiE6 [Bacteroidota bacterium]
MKWYDFFSGFYDKSLEKLYFDSRQRAAELLDLKNASSVLDVACGTGANFKHIKQLNPSIKIVGTDYSQGMLNKAKQLCEKNSWTDTILFQADARDLSTDYILKHTGSNDGFDRIICALGMSVIPDWEKVLNNLISLLNPRGKIVLIDVFAEKRNMNSWLVEKMAKADLNRTIFQQLEKRTINFHKEYIHVSELKVGGKLFVAVGGKK